MDHVKCAFCAKTIDTVEEAIETGWEPTFYVPGDAIESGEPACPACQQEHLEWHGDELTLKPGHPDPTSMDRAVGPLNLTQTIDLPPGIT